MFVYWTPLASVQTHPLVEQAFFQIGCSYELHIAADAGTHEGRSHQAQVSVRMWSKVFSNSVQYQPKTNLLVGFRSAMFSGFFKTGWYGVAPYISLITQRSVGQIHPGEPEKTETPPRPFAERL